MDALATALQKSQDLEARVAGLDERMSIRALEGDHWVGIAHFACRRLAEAVSLVLAVCAWTRGRDKAAKLYPPPYISTDVSAFYATDGLADPAGDSQKLVDITSSGAELFDMASEDDVDVPLVELQKEIEKLRT